jgi:FAD/FMN-containing dehydrogenase
MNIESDNSSETLDKYSHDTSIFEVRPKQVFFPKNSAEIGELIRQVSQSSESLTVRAAGTDMTGGPLSESNIVDVSRYLNRIGDIQKLNFEDPQSLTFVTVEPGVYYRDFETKTLEQGLILPCFPASKSLCALGGMLGNNCAGEKTLRYGKMENFVLETKVVFSDGNEYTVKPLTDTELTQKIAENTFEGDIYKRVYNLLQSNQQLIHDAKPNVSKNSAGYYLWNVYKDGVFDLNKLLVGSQGTLGIITEAKLRLEPEKKHHDLVALFFHSWDELPRVVNALLPYQPESLETFDEETLKLGLRFMPEIAKRAHSSFLKFALQFLPEALIGARMHGLPKLIVLVEIAEETEEEVKKKVESVVNAIKPFKTIHRVINKDSEEEKFWVMRRESFNLLRQHVQGKRTAPFIEDFCIPTEHVPAFLPQAIGILKASGIHVNIAGHAGNGNFHIIPLMDLTQRGERKKIVTVSDQFYDLVAKYKGTITGEHNDGIIRTPYLGKMYSPEVLDLFRQVKNIFDPKNIFNPGKKVPTSTIGTIPYLESHITLT